MMNLKHFKIEYNLGKRQDLITKHQSDFEKLDQILEQYQDQDFDWYLDWNHNSFELVCAYQNNNHNGSYPVWKEIWNLPEAIFISSNISQFANANYLQKGLEMLKMVVSHPKIKQEAIIVIKTKLDKLQISLVHNGNASLYDQNQFKFFLSDFDHGCDLISKAIDFSTILNSNRNDQNIALQDSLELQVLKMIIDREVDQNLDQFIQKLKRDLADPKANFYRLSCHLDHQVNDDDLRLNQLDWRFVITKNEKIQCVATINYDGEYYSFPPLELSFETIAKLTNNQQIKTVLKSWQQALASKQKQIEKVSKTI